MGCIRVEKITEYLCEPLSRCLKDEVIHLSHKCWSSNSIGHNTVSFFSSLISSYLFFFSYLLCCYLFLSSALFSLHVFPSSFSISFPLSTILSTLSLFSTFMWNWANPRYWYESILTKQRYYIDWQKFSRKIIERYRLRRTERWRKGAGRFLIWQYLVHHYMRTIWFVYKSDRILSSSSTSYPLSFYPLPL